MITSLVNEAATVPCLAGGAKPVGGGRTSVAGGTSVLAAIDTCCLGRKGKRAAWQLKQVTVAAGPTGSKQIKWLRRCVQGGKWQFLQVHTEGTFKLQYVSTVHHPER